MPKKFKKTKRNVINNKPRNVQLSEHCKNVNIGYNFEKWTNIKHKLKLESDEEFAKYLLDIAELKLSDSQDLKDDTTPNNNGYISEEVEVHEISDFKHLQKSQSSPHKTESKVYKKHTSIFNASVTKIKSVDTEPDAKTDSITCKDTEDDTHKQNTTDDEEKENVGVFIGESQPRISTDLSAPLLVDNVAIRNTVNVDSCDDDDVLKENEPNLDYTKPIRKHKKKRGRDNVVNGLPVEASHNTSKHKKKKHKLPNQIEVTSEHATISESISSNSIVIREDSPTSGESSAKLTSNVNAITSLNEEVQDSKTDSSDSFSVNCNDDSSVVVTTNDNLKSGSSNYNSETHRVSITIKLCCDCDSRHLQDGCPLRNPQLIIGDLVDFDQWLGSRSPDVQYNDEESSLEAKQDFASASLPDCLQLREIDSEHGLSVVANREFPASTQFGPLIGQPIREMEIPDDFSMRDIWEVLEDGKCGYLSTQDVDSSNWLRWLRPAPSREMRNLAPIQIESRLYFVTTMPVEKGEELLYWTDYISSDWSNKNMTKSNCGGCNLRFYHSIYYRRHCVVFHDPKYSLTIRKYHCKICGLSVLGKENIMKHAADEHNGKGAYQCQFCKKFFLRLNYLEMHRTYGCAANPHRTRPLCDYCGRKFCQPQKLKIHIKRMHSEISEVLREFQCKRCMKVLGSRAALQRHIKEVHHKAMVGSCTCDKCGKMFQNKSNLKIHMLTHSGIKPFRCQEESCSAAFTTKQCLQFHYKKVHGFTDSMMPRIERSVAYTFDAYAGEMDPNSIDSNCSSNSSNIDDQEKETDRGDVMTTDRTDGVNHNESTTLPETPMDFDISNNRNMKHPFIENNKLVVASKASKKWMGERDKSDELMVEFNDNSEQKNMDDLSGKTQDDEEGPVSMIFRHCNKPDSTNASMLVEAALNAAERDIDMTPVKLPSPVHHHNKLSPFYPIIQGVPNAMSPNRDVLKSITPNAPSHLDYALHSSMQDIGHMPTGHGLDSTGYPTVLSPSRHTNSGYGLIFPDRTPHYELRLSPTGQMDSFHIHPDETRYDLHHPHRRLDIDCSSDEGDGVQNLSLGLKSKSPSSMQLDLSSTTYNKYEHTIQEDHATNGFVESSLEGLDMSRSSVYHHSSFVSMTSHRYPHTLYDQRPTYSHSDVLRVVNLTHSVDLSLPRANHLPLPSTSSQPIIEPIRVLSPPTSYQNYPLSQSPYLTAARSSHSPTYHHYSGY